MKKLLLSLGALSAVVAPVAAVVACGSHHAEKVKAGTPTGTPTGTPAKPETSGTADTLAGMKTNDLATAETLTLGSVTKQALIDHINGATTLDELTGYMTEANTASTNANAKVNKAAELAAHKTEIINQLTKKVGDASDVAATTEFTAIDSAITTATANINAATDTDGVDSALTAGNAAIDAANKAYTAKVNADKAALAQVPPTGDNAEAVVKAIDINTDWDNTELDKKDAPFLNTLKVSPLSRTKANAHYMLHIKDADITDIFVGFDSISYSSDKHELTIVKGSDTKVFHLVSTRLYNYQQKSN